MGLKRPSTDGESIPHSKPWVSSRELQAVNHILRTAQVSGALNRATFEEHLRGWCHGASLKVTRSGKEALTSVLRNVRHERRNEVVVQTYVCREVLESIRTAGLTPVLIDVSADGTIGAEQLEQAISHKTLAVIAVNLFGQRVEVPALRQALGKHEQDIRVIVDACQDVQPSPVPSDSSIFATVFSFGATKAWTAGGAGGAFSICAGADGSSFDRSATATNDAEFPLSGMEYAFGTAQLKRYGDFVARRALIRDQYDAASNGLTVRGNGHASSAQLFRYVMWAPQGFTFAQQWFRARGVTVRRGVDALLHRTEARSSDRDFPVASDLFHHHVSVPYFPALTDSQVLRVVTALEDFPR